MEVPGEDPTLPEGWIKCFSKSWQNRGRRYFFNTLTGEALWEHPEAILLDDQKQTNHVKINSSNDTRGDEQHRKETPANLSQSKKRGQGKESIKPLARILKTPKGVQPKKDNKKKHIEKTNPSKKGGNIANTGTSSIKGKSFHKPVQNSVKVPELVQPRKVTAHTVPINMGAPKPVPISKRISKSVLATESGLKNDLNSRKSTPAIVNKVPAKSPAKKTSLPVKDASNAVHAREGVVSSGSSNSNDDRRNRARNAKQKLFVNDTEKSKQWQGPKSSKADFSNKTLHPLRPLRKNRSNKTLPVRKKLGNGYKIPRKDSEMFSPETLITQPQKPLNGGIIPGVINNEPKYRLGQFSESTETLVITRDGSSRTVRSVDGMSERGSPSWSTSDVVMDTQEMDTFDDPDCFVGLDEIPGDYDVSETVNEVMDIDDSEYMAKTIFKQIEDIRNERIKIPKTTDDHLTTMEEEPFKIQEGSLYIVLDTNILLSHLKFVSELRDSAIPGAGRPTLIIPWMVVQELDRLKTAPDSRVHEFAEGEGQEAVGVNVLARRAVAFLHNCFSQNHPRIRGQTVIEANQSLEGFVEESNDDSILLCCLLFKQKAAESMTVLLSNDRNLCNKAIMSGVKAFTKKILLDGLRDLFQSGNIIVHKEHFREYFNEAEVQELLAERRRKADDLTCELQCILREGFTAVIKKEMIEAYDDLWLEIVRIKPPWTLLDTLDLLEKHWIAVFGQIIRRNLRETVVQLKKMFSSGDAALRNLELTGEMIQLGTLLCDAFSKHDDYSGVLPKCFAGMLVLQRTHKEIVTSFSSRNEKQHEPNFKLRPLPQPNDRGDSNISGCVTTILHEDQPTALLKCTEHFTEHCIWKWIGGQTHRTFHRTCSQAKCAIAGTETSCDMNSSVPKSRAEHEAEDAHQPGVVKPPHFVVMNTFDEIWKAVTVLSSSIFESVDYPNPFRSKNDQLNPRPSKDEAFRFLGQFIPCLGCLVQAIQGVIACPLEVSLENSAIFTELGQSIAQFMKVMMCQECKITFEQLRDFCMDNLSRTALIQGLSQLDRALAMLQHCSSFGTKRS